ncbi:MAG: TIR domain-containing protein [Anaerolineales bacterium]|nr:TIR domain-containing protein [Anaerolineales bacterium]
MPIDKRPLKVFLSYASQDRSLVRELSRQLMGEGWIDIWRDEKNLLPGQDWRVKIEEAVEEADVVIICLSNHSVSKEGHVQKELRYAREIALEKPEDAIFLIPLRLDECEVPRGLRFYQWVDYFGESKDSSYKALVTSLEYRYEQKIKIEEKERLKENRSNELFVDVKPLHADDESRDQFKKNEPKTENEKNSYPARRIKLGRPNPYWIAGFMLLGLGAVLASIFNNQTGVVTPTPSLTFTLTGTTSPALLPTQNATDEPDKPSCVYTVKESDTFIGIAYKFGVTMNDITCAAVDSSGCDLSNPIGIQIGWALQIPDIAPEVCLSNSGQVGVLTNTPSPDEITSSFTGMCYYHSSDSTTSLAMALSKFSLFYDGTADYFYCSEMKGLGCTGKEFIQNENDILPSDVWLAIPEIKDRADCDQGGGIVFGN